MAADEQPRKPLKPEEFAQRMREIEHEFSGDPEKAHVRADNLICELLRELGYQEGVEVFENIEMWYA